jgi:hypothetical protein
MRVLLVLVLAITGCTPFELVRPAQSPASIGVTVEITHDSLSFESVRGFLQNGRDDAGNELPIADSVLYLDGIVVQPTQASTRGLLVYDRDRNLGTATTAPTTLAVTLPVVGSPGEATSFTIQLPAREDPRAIGVDPGGVIRLRVSSLATPPSLERLSTRWELTVRPSCSGSGQQLLSLFGTGQYQPEMRLARELIGETNASEVSVCFRAEASYRHPSTDVSKILTVFLRIEWRVTL